MSELSREQFLQQVLDCVAERFPLVRIAAGDEPFSVSINGHLAPLENLYRAAQLRPGHSRQHIERWVVELLRVAEGTPDRTGSFDELKDRILPMIVAEKPGEHNVDRHRGNVTAPFVEGLSVAYAIDSDRTIAYLPEVQFKAWDVSLEELHETALGNLVKRSETMNARAVQDDDGRVSLILFQTMDGYDASRILLPTLHDRLREHLGSPFAAAIPNRDILLCFRDEEA